MRKPLKPCPCCGAKVHAYEEEEDGPGGPVPSGWTIFCGCGLRMTADTYGKMSKAWNKRDKDRQ